LELIHENSLSPTFVRDKLLNDGWPIEYNIEVTNINKAMLGEQTSLVKYSTPVLVSGSSKTHHNKKTKKEEDETHHTEDILGEILPPKEHLTNNGQLWVQTVLSTPATKI
jgi:hypothetical protein